MPEAVFSWLSRCLYFDDANTESWCVEVKCLACRYRRGNGYDQVRLFGSIARILASCQLLQGTGRCNVVEWKLEDEWRSGADCVCHLYSQLTG